MGGLLHLVQRGLGGAWAGCDLPSPLLAVPNVTAHRGLLQLVQRGGPGAGCDPAQTPPRCTKCNSPPINGQFTNHCIAIWWSVALRLKGQRTQNTQTQTVPHSCSLIRHVFHGHCNLGQLVYRSHHENLRQLLEQKFFTDEIAFLMPSQYCQKLWRQLNSGGWSV